jgi:hypothetical protein
MREGMHVDVSPLHVELIWQHCLAQLALQTVKYAAGDAAFGLHIAFALHPLLKTAEMNEFHAAVAVARGQEQVIARFFIRETNATGRFLARSFSI